MFSKIIRKKKPKVRQVNGLRGELHGNAKNNYFW